MEHKWKIGNVKISDRVVAASMAGIANSASRVTVKKFGAGLVVCETISDRGIYFGNKKTLEMLHIEETGHSLSLRIPGGNKGGLVEAAQFIEENTTADITDISVGCPIDRVIRAEAGAKQLLDPEKIYETVQAASSTVDIPIAVKMHTSWDEEYVLTVENVLAAQSAGASTVAMHGCTRVQMYEGKVDWEILKEAKKHLTTPFTGNRDVKTLGDARRVLDYAGVDSVMIGRAALGSSWMIHRIQYYLETEELTPEPTPAEKIAIAKLHL